MSGSIPMPITSEAVVMTEGEYRRQTGSTRSSSDRDAASRKGCVGEDPAARMRRAFTPPQRWRRRLITDEMLDAALRTECERHSVRIAGQTRHSPILAASARQ